MTEVRCDFCDLFCFGGILWTCGTFRPGNVSPVVIRCHPFAQGPQGPFPSFVLLRRATSTSPFGRCSPASSAPFWASCWRPTRIVFPQLRRCVFWISCLFTKQIRRASGSVDDNEFQMLLAWFLALIYRHCES